MKISEMNNCIETMRDCYNFKDDETEINVSDGVNYGGQRVSVYTRDKNGTKIEMTKYLDRIKDNK